MGSFHGRGEEAAEFLYGAEDAMFGGTLADVERFRNFSNRLAFKVAEHKGRALLGGECFHGKLEAVLELGIEQQSVREGGVVGRVQGEIARVRDMFAAADKVKRVIDGDALEPGGEAGAIVKGIESAVAAEKRLLDHVFGIGRITGDSPSHAIQQAAMGFDQLLERLSVAGAESCHKLPVNRNHLTDRLLRGVAVREKFYG